MDTKKHFYFFVAEATAVSNEEETVVLGGCDFHGGLASSVLNRLSRKLWFIDSKRACPIKGSVDAAHVQRRGWQLYLTGETVKPWPCLLTTDPKMQYMFSGLITIEADDSTFDVTEAFEDPVPLCGEKWLGVVHPVSGGLQLDAFSSDGENHGTILKAYCPWWSESLGDPEGVVFTARKTGALGVRGLLGSERR